MVLSFTPVGGKDNTNSVQTATVGIPRNSDRGKYLPGCIALCARRGQLCFVEVPLSSRSNQTRSGPMVHTAHQVWTDGAYSTVANASLSSPGRAWLLKIPGTVLSNISPRGG
eukprot:3889359-Rhodomonas_salina.1